MTILVPSTERVERPSEPSLVAKGLKKAVKNIATTVPRPPIRIARRSRLTRAERRPALANACSRSTGGATFIRRAEARAEEAAFESESAALVAIGLVWNAGIDSLFSRLTSPKNPNSVAKLGPGPRSQSRTTGSGASPGRAMPFSDDTAVDVFDLDHPTVAEPRSPASPPRRK